MARAYSLPSRPGDSTSVAGYRAVRGDGGASLVRAGRRLDVAWRVCVGSIAALAALAAFAVSAALVGASGVVTWPHALPAVVATLAAVASLSLFGSTLAIPHAWNAAQPDRALPARGAWIAGAVLLFAAATTLLTGAASSPAPAVSAYVSLGSGLLVLAALGLVLLALTHAAVALGRASTTWRANVYGQLAGLLLLALGLGVLTASGEIVPLVRLLEASLAVQLFAGCVALLGGLVGTWVILGLHLMRKELAPTLRHPEADDGSHDDVP